MRLTALIAALVAAGAASAQDAKAPTDVTYTDDGAIEASLTGQAGDPAQGAIAFASKSVGNCVACHQVSSLDAAFQGEIGPALDGVADRWEEANIRGIVANAKKTYPGTMMPAFYKTEGYIRPGDAFTGKAADEPLPPLMTAEQIEDVVAYLMTLKEQS